MGENFREIVVDLDAVTANVQRLRALTGTPHLMAVVKANAYGHGALPCARAALAGGADWLGVAEIPEALALRAAGIDAPLLAWLHDPDEDFVAAIDARIDIGVSSLAQLDAVASAARSGEVAYIQIKVDTGLSRNGVAHGDWPAVFERAAQLQRSGMIVVRGLFSHLSGASLDDDRESLVRFEQARLLLESRGISPKLLHVAASLAALTLPESRLTMVRPGVSVYGLGPSPAMSGADWGLRPAMTVRTRVAALRRVPEQTGVSYDYTYRTDSPTTLALIPVGYAEGIPRRASNAGSVLIGGERYRVAGRVAMDQFVVDVGDAPVTVGDEVVVFGDPAFGYPSADEWALAAETINYEIVTRMGGRLRYRFIGGVQ